MRCCHIHRGRFDEAKVILCKLRHLSEDHPDILNEFNQITSSVTMEKEQDGTKWKELCEPHNLRRLALGCFMQIAQQWTGTNAIVGLESVSTIHPLTSNYTELLWPSHLPNNWPRKQHVCVDDWCIRQV